MDYQVKICIINAITIKINTINKFLELQLFYSINGLLFITVYKIKIKASTMNNILIVKEFKEK